jgi:hypothetical protein
VEGVHGTRPPALEYVRILCDSAWVDKVPLRRGCLRAPRVLPEALSIPSLEVLRYFLSNGTDHQRDCQNQPASIWEQA